MAAANEKNNEKDTPPSEGPQQVDATKADNVKLNKELDKIKKELEATKKKLKYAPDPAVIPKDQLELPEGMQDGKM